MTEAPWICPFLKECKEKVLRSTFENKCNCDNWIYCDSKQVRKWREERSKTPAEWRLIKELEKR